MPLISRGFSSLLCAHLKSASLSAREMFGILAEPLITNHAPLAEEKFQQIENNVQIYRIFCGKRSNKD